MAIETQCGEFEVRIDGDSSGDSITQENYPPGVLNELNSIHKKFVIQCGQIFMQRLHRALKYFFLYCLKIIIDRYVFVGTVKGLTGDLRGQGDFEIMIP